MTRTPVLFAAFLLLIAATGCERPFVDVSSPTVEVVAPDPRFIQEEASIVLRVRTGSFRDVDRVEIGGQPFEKASNGEWSRAISLRPGVNRLIIEAFDLENVAGVDTVHFLYLEAKPQPHNWEWTEARGGHAAVRDGLGRVQLIGGANALSGQASDRIDAIGPGESRVLSSETHLLSGRVGHTASLLPDGRILIAGGASVPTPDNVAQLVEAPELYDPVSGAIKKVTVSGFPIRRAFHTAQVRRTSRGLLIDLLGGSGDVQYIPSPIFGFREDIRTFLLEGDSLVALSPPIGPYIDLLSGHSQTPLARQPLGVPTRQLVSGAIFSAGRTEAFHFVMDPRGPLGFEFEDLRPPLVSRRFHAAVLVGPGLVLMHGGQTSSGIRATSSAALYEDTIRSFFAFSEDGRFISVPRYLHTATNLGDDRILVSGGFSSDGSAVTTVEIFDFTP